MSFPYDGIEALNALHIGLWNTRSSTRRRDRIDLHDGQWFIDQGARAAAKATTGVALIALAIPTISIALYLLARAFT